jgi:hypothetical protein
MKGDLKEKWVRALRSGEYAQGKGLLREYNPVHKQDQFCCLGVLCDIVAKEGLEGEDGKKFVWGDDDHAFIFRNDRSATELPPGLRRTVGVSDELQYQLIALNDGGSNFGQIAKVIEEQA